MLLDGVANSLLLRANTHERLALQRAQIASTPTKGDRSSAFATQRRLLLRQSVSIALALLRNFVVLPTATHYAFEVRARTCVCLCMSSVCECGNFIVARRSMLAC